MTAVHKGWGMTNGRSACGRRGKLTSLDLERITCRGCLWTMLREAQRELSNANENLRTASRECNEIERQYLRQRK